jgi:DNA mismatch repair protein MutS
VRLLINFVDETTVNSLLAISRVEVHSEQGRVEIDATTRRNLELVQTLRDGRVEGSLFHFLDRATTVGGKRLLREWLIRPLSDQMAIRCRHDAVETLCGSIDITKEISEVLRRFSDLERCAARIDLGIISPKELAAMRDSLGLLHDIQEALARVEKRSIGSSQELQRISQDLYAPAEVQELLDGVLVESPPYVLHEGGIFCDGHHEELDRYRMIRKDGRSWIAQLEAREREATGISSLKIKFNNAMGYFFEVTRANAEKVPEHYTRRQTMTNASRFITEELKNQEEEILGAKGAQIALEKRLFDELRQALLPFAARLREIYRSVATLDVLMSFALIADAQDYCRPTMVSTRCLSIDQGRHPVLAQLLEGRFVPNSLSLNADETSCVVLTGANMGGKSTFLRQAALITLLAHCGSFIPAKEATIGVVDKIFARLGASDDMAEGESTFMVEMREASHILASATENSLVLIDEIGRGTATADGLAIAQSILEWIVKEIGCLTLFATHFHELTDLESRYPHIGNFSVGSVDRGGEVHFTHQICRGAANRSYGLEVARLAALPEDVLARARALLSDFQRSGQVVNSQQLSFFEPTPAVAREVAPTIPEDYDFLKNLQKELQEIDINNLTPLEALTLLEKFRNKST